jgi:hypothetical protein
MNGFFIESVQKETRFFWYYKITPSTEPPFTIKEYLEEEKVNTFEF